MANLKLNMLPVVETDFSFMVYRKIRTDNEPSPENIYSYYLWADIETKEKKSFWVSFSPMLDYEEYVATSHECIDLTKRKLLFSLNDTISNAGLDLKAQLISKLFKERIEFILTQYSQGNQIILLSPYYLQEQHRFGFLIDFKFSKNKTSPFDKQVQVYSLSLDKNGKSNKNYYSDKFNYVQFFIEKQFTKIRTILLGMENKIDISPEMIEVPAFLLNKKEYIFSNKSTSNSQFQGIKNFGPYEKLEKEVIYIFIFEDKFKSFANDLYLSLTGKSNPGTFPGLEAMFGIKMQVSNVRQIKLESYSQDHLLDIANKVQNIQNENKEKKVIGVYIEDYFDDDEDMSVSDHYYFLKYHFISRDIPLQVVNYRRLGGKNSLKWSTSNLGLAMFAKMGGKPWIVKPSNNNCLILGIGSSHKRDPESGNISKYFAYTVCLDSSGLYRALEILSDNTSEESYLENLQNNLIRLLREDRFSKYKTCVLHLPFKIKKKEIQAIANAISTISDINFVAVKINLENKFFGYSSHNTMVPYESSFLRLSKSEFLVWFEGLLYGKEAVDKRLANPVHIQFLHLGNKLPIDEESYLQDVLNLSGANWRGFNAKSVPISIYYSQLIARYTEAFEKVAGYQENSISNSNPWFL